jgi:hypothetical protein
LASFVVQKTKTGFTPSALETPKGEEENPEKRYAQSLCPGHIFFSGDFIPGL